MFFTIDKDYREKKSVVLIIDFCNPSITLRVKEGSSPATMLDPSNIILHIEPNYITRSVDRYNLAEIVCFTYFYICKQDKRFMTKTGMRNYANPETIVEIEQNVAKVF